MKKTRLREIKENKKEDIIIDEIDNEEDIYSEEGAESLVENDEISEEEQAFMNGYLNS